MILSHTSDAIFWDTTWSEQLAQYAVSEELQRRTLIHALENNVSSEAPRIVPISCGDGIPLMEYLSGTQEQRFAELRALLAYQTACAGKKLLFMGNELGQNTRWSATRPIDWKIGEHGKGLQRCVADLNFLYLQNPALEGIAEVEPKNESGLLVIWHKHQTSRIAAVINLSPYRYSAYRMGVPEGTSCEEIFNSDRTEYGGQGVLNSALQVEKIGAHGRKHSIEINLSPRTAVFIRIEH